MFNNNILRLDISMYNPITMNIRNRLKDMTQDNFDLFLTKLSILFDIFQEMISWAIFHDEVNVLFSVEHAVELDDVWVVEEKLDFDLADEWDF